MRAMKNSGIEWIGEIPDGWGISKVSRFYSVILGKMLSPVKEATDSTLENYLCAQNIKWDGINTSEIKQMWFSCCEKEKYLLENQDVIVTEGGDIGVSSVYNGEFFPCYIQNAVHKVTSRSGNKSENKLFYYWMHLVKNSGYLDLICNKATIAHFTKEKLSSTPMIVIPSKQQHHIASFLDTKCSLIDTTIEKEREVIDKLKEYRQAVITEAVTKGIRAGVPMKDSGVEWIGEIPEHWNCVDFRRAVHLKQGLQIEQTKRFSDNGDNRFVYITLKYVNSIKSPEDTEYIENPDSNVMCDYGDILFVRTGATGLIVTNVFGVYHNNFFKIIFDKKLISKRYLIDYLSQKSIQAHFNLLAGTTTIPDLNHGDFLSTKVLIPPLPEQQEIADYLDKKCSEIDATIQKRELAIEKLTAYKQSLIYECVTGKKEVLG